MRLTRPGARKRRGSPPPNKRRKASRRAPGSDTSPALPRPDDGRNLPTQLGGLLLGQRVVDEHPGAGLAAGQVLELRLRPQRRAEIEVGMGVVVSAGRGGAA